VVSAAECREILGELDVIGIKDPPVGGSVSVAIGDPDTGEVIAVATRAELRKAAGRGRRRRRRRGGPDSLTRPRTAPPDGLFPPPDTPAYQPTAAQKRLVQARDRRCRMPGCRRRVGRCDLDHHRPHDQGGPTACRNLCCLCKRHHRIKTLARDWSFRLVGNRLIVRTPGGVTRETRPPGWCHDPEPEPPWLDELAPPHPMRQ
jgi:hypothetical protein